MDADCEILALVIDDPPRNAGPASRTVAELARSAHCLVRDAAGQMTLKAVESQEEFDRTVRTTGCFRRGKAIHDPSSHQVIGYELEEVSLLQATAGR